MDNLSSTARSLNMAQIRHRGTKPERNVLRLLRQLGFYPRQNVRTLPGCPDLVLAQLRKIVFVNGCYWHRHECRRGTSVPTTRVVFWQKKFVANKRRDAAVQRRLRRLGWSVVTVWECQLKRPELVRQRLRRFIERNTRPPYDGKAQPSRRPKR